MEAESFNQLPGTDLSQKHFQDARLQAPEQSWNANLEDYRKQSLMPCPGSELFVLSQGTRQLSEESNEAFNISSTFPEVSSQGQPELRSAPSDPQVEQTSHPQRTTIHVRINEVIPGIRLKVKDADGHEIVNDRTIRYKVKEVPLTPQQPPMPKQPDPFANLQPGEILHPLRDIDTRRPPSVRPKLRRQAESGFMLEDACNVPYDKLPDDENEPLLSDAGFMKSDDSTAVPVRRLPPIYNGEYIRPGEDDFTRPDMQERIRLEGEMIQIGVEYVGYIGDTPIPFQDAVESPEPVPEVPEPVTEAPMPTSTIGEQPPIQHILQGDVIWDRKPFEEFTTEQIERGDSFTSKGYKPPKDIITPPPPPSDQPPPTVTAEQGLSTMSTSRESDAGESDLSRQVPDVLSSTSSRVVAEPSDTLQRTEQTPSSDNRKGIFVKIRHLFEH